MATRSKIQEWARRHVRGLFYGLTTPFTGDGKQIDEEKLRHNIRHCVAMRPDGLGWGGPLAEVFTLTVGERKRGHEILAEEARKAGVCCYAYPVADSIPIALELTAHAASVGCDLVMVNVPFEWTKTQRMITKYYSLMAEAAGPAGIMLYDTPHSGMQLSVDILDELADLPNVCAMKPGFPLDKDNAAALIDRLGDRVVLSAGSPDTWPAFERLGYQLLPPTSATYMMQTEQWQPIREVIDLCSQHRYDEATELSRRISPLKASWQRVYKSYFERPMGHEEHPVAGIKAWIGYLGMHGGPVREPISPPEPGEFDWIAGELEGHRRSGLLHVERL
jgi:4-hydroxy-tetrahydrodipicolinate synthase